MQIIFFLVFTLAIIVFLIYTINKRFGVKEFFILVAVLVIPLGVISFLLNKIANEVPDIFKNKYQKEKKVEITKLSYERINNKNLSSNSNYVYNFEYIIKKDNKELVCSAKKVKVKKIQDEFVFENFNNLDEKCLEK